MSKFIHTTAERTLCRKSITMFASWMSSLDSLEQEIFGGYLEFLSPGDALNQVKAAVEKLEREGTKDIPAAPDHHLFENIMTGAALGASDQEIASDEWIDGVLDEVKESHAGFWVREKGSLIPYTPIEKR